MTIIKKMAVASTLIFTCSLAEAAIVTVSGSVNLDASNFFARDENFNTVANVAPPFSTASVAFTATYDDSLVTSTLQAVDSFSFSLLVDGVSFVNDAIYASFRNLTPTRQQVVVGYGDGPFTPNQNVGFLPQGGVDDFAFRLDFLEGETTPESNSNLTFSFQSVENMTFTGGPFYPGFTRNIATVPVPTATWLFISGLLGVFGISKRKTSA